MDRDEPVSTIPAVLARMVVEPYSMDRSIPQYALAGNVVVIGTYCMGPVVLLTSGAPKDNSPESSSVNKVLGRKKTPKTGALIDP